MKHWQIRIGTLLAVVVLLTMLLSTGAVTWLNYQRDIAAGEAATSSLFMRLVHSSNEQVADLEHRGEHLTSALLLNSAIAMSSLDEGLEHQVAIMTQLMKPNDSIYSLFKGLDDGTYLEVSNLEASPGMRAAWQASPEDRWVVMVVRGGQETRQYLDAQLSVNSSSVSASGFEAKRRPWFVLANEEGVSQTEPYALTFTANNAISFVQKTSRQHVVGAIVLLNSLDDLLKNSGLQAGYEAIIFNSNGTAIAQHPFDGVNGTETGEHLQALRSLSESDSTLGVLTINNIEGEPHYIFLDILTHSAKDDVTVFMGVSVARNVVLAPYLENAQKGVLLAGIVTLIMLVAALFASGLITRPITRLSRITRQVRDQHFDDVEPVHSRIREVQWLSDSLVSMSADIRAYQQQQRALQDGIVGLIATAIDQKSPYTGGHCERVPELGIALANAAGASNDDAFSDFDFNSELKQREFEVAAWLYDCGKITTPEYIVDKGSKLETLYNRIHEVRMRFEVLLRDAQIQFLEAVSAAPENRPSLEAELRQQRQAIIDDFEFIAECNVGGEFMDDAKLERLAKIAQRTWQRHLSDRLGLSPVEQARLEDVPQVSLPVTETVLRDTAEHCLPRENTAIRYPGLGFTLMPPDLQLNLGEHYNLSVRAGTLTNEERYLINEHICATIKMLESLPWPDELARVPEYAGGHHEKIDGTGYPRSLKGEALSIPAKILAVADIMEALTAGDRPYKKAKPLSAALSIMRSMALGGHIDPALFKLLIESGVYRDYARRFLRPEQLDAVDEESLLAGL